MLLSTNDLQFIVTILGPRKPDLGEVFEIELLPRRERLEVEAVEIEGSLALVERTDDGPALKGDIRSRVIGDPNRKNLSGSRRYDHTMDRNLRDDYQRELEADFLGLGPLLEADEDDQFDFDDRDCSSDWESPRFQSDR